MANNFLIVGMGGSGTRFLAEYLNKSQYLWVDHEGNPHRHPGKVQQANQWYQWQCKQMKRDGKNYGDVNGFMRYALPDYCLPNKAIILRDWREILMSWASHWGKSHDTFSPEWVDAVQSEIQRRRWLWHVERTVSAFESAIARVTPIIFFHKMVTDPQYLQFVCFQFGAVDLRPSQSDLARKVNSHNKGRVTEYADIPAVIREPFDKLTAPFNQEHILPYV